MKRNLELSKFPLLRNLMGFQILAICLILSVLMGTIIYEQKIRIHSALNEVKEQLEPALAARQDQWRTWNYFKLDPSLNAELKEIRDRFALKRLEILPAQSAPSAASHRVMLPKAGQNDSLETVVYAEIDLDALTAREGLGDQIYFGVIALAIACLLLIVISAAYIHKRIYQPLISLGRTIEEFRAGEELDIKKINAHGEMKNFLALINEMYLITRNAERSAALGEMAKQVAHDIRSPLAALQVLSASLEDIPEEHRLILRTATSRIRDTAKNLLNKNPNPGTLLPNELPEQPVTELLSRVISEKRVEYQNMSELNIQLEGAPLSYAFFSKVEPSVFQRILSNVLNNAIEAYPESGGKISVAITGTDTEVIVSARDWGRGIPFEILERLNTSGGSFGKEKMNFSGHGLGLSHAREAISRWGGTLTLASIESEGTSLTIRLPRSPIPEWFVGELKLGQWRTIVIVDDDLAIHRIWDVRLRSFEQDNRKILHFRSLAELDALFRDRAFDAKDAFFLIDCEFVGKRENGIDAIERLAIVSRGVLVTSRPLDLDVVERCKKLEIKLLPKEYISAVEIN